MDDAKVIIYSTTWCAFCKTEKQYLEKLGVAFVEKDIEADAEAHEELMGKIGGNFRGGKAVTQAAGVPLTTIDQATATTLAAQSCTSCELVTQSQWMTVMHNALNVSGNWSGNSVGSGFIYSGHNDNSPNSAQAASTDDSDGYFGTGNSAGSNQRRTLRLNNGEVIWDLAGNVWEWTAGTVSGGQPGASGYAWREWNAGGLSAGTFTPNSFPSFGTPAASGWTSANGIGRLYSNSTEAGLRGIARGGFWNSGANAGIATLNFNDPPTNATNATGFRIAFNPTPPLACETGFVKVPGNDRFGTSDFCAGKYEAKNVGGVATTQAAGGPWSSISQNNAVIAANAACATCRLIGEAEWLTIAHNVVNVGSNWTGNAVGSGTMYNGHNDGSPASNLAASSDDNDGYSGTGNVANSGQRRTLTLSNGEVIWDFSGNVWEWTSGQMTGGQPGAAGYAWREWNAVARVFTMSPNPYPIYGTPAASAWTGANGIGMVNSSTSEATLRAFRRGGGRGNGATAAGVFALGLASDPTATSADIGFRVVDVR